MRTLMRITFFLVFALALLAGCKRGVEKKDAADADHSSKNTIPPNEMEKVKAKLKPGQTLPQ